LVGSATAALEAPADCAERAQFVFGVKIAI
jgi:hypothetical protein